MPKEPTTSTLLPTPVSYPHTSRVIFYFPENILTALLFSYDTLKPHPLFFFIYKSPLVYFLELSFSLDVFLNNTVSRNLGFDGIGFVDILGVFPLGKKMVDGGGGVVFPVIFFDGERDLNIGDVMVHPTMEFKTLQAVISQKIGISPNQISIYLYDQKTGQRTPVTSKVNFSVVVCRMDCFFHVVLKRSRKSKARKLPRSSGSDYGDYLLENDYSPPSPSDNVILLRRNHPEMNLNMNGLRAPDYPTPFYGQFTESELAGLSDRLHYLKIQRGNLVSSMAKRPSNMNQKFMIPTPAPTNLNPLYDSKSFPRIQDTVAKKVPVCEYCANEKKNDETPSFHHCVNDEVIDSHIPRVRFGHVGRRVKISKGASIRSF